MLPPSQSGSATDGKTTGRSTGVILLLTIYCFSRVLLAKKKKAAIPTCLCGTQTGLWGARAMFIGLILLTVLMVWLAWRKKNKQSQKE